MPQRPKQWTTITIKAEETEIADERRLHQEYSLHLEREGRPDGAVIYWRSDGDGVRVYYFSPEAATIAGPLLEPFSPRLVTSPDLPALRGQGAMIANWRHSYVNLR